MVMRFPAKKNAGCPKAPCDFPPRQDFIPCPRRVLLGLPSPSHRVCGRTDVRMYGCTDGRSRDYYVTTKISRIDRLPTELNNAERSAVRNAGDRARTRLGDWAGLAGYLKWPVFVGFSRTVNNPVG